MIRGVAFFLAVFVLPAALVAAKPRPDNAPPRIIETVTPRFPDALIHQDIFDGEARIVLLIDADGKLVDWLLTGFTHPLLGREATEAVRQWRYEPGRRGGEPIDIRTEVIFSFRAGGMIVTLNPGEPLTHLVKPEAKKSPPRLCAPQELDTPLELLDSVAPMSPESLGAKHEEGRVVLDFFIDERGRTRMPVVTSSDDDAFAKSAVEALSHFRFSAPTRGGMPVLVHAAQAFHFSLPK